MNLNEYLDRKGLSSYFKDMLVQLASQQPANPIEFMREYFDNVVSGTPPLMKAFKLIKTSKPDSSTFVDAVNEAYLALTSSGTQALGGKGLGELLGMLCSDLPISSSELLLRAMQRKDYEPVSHECFRATVTSVCLCLHMVHEAQALFRSLDKENQGTIERRLAQAIIDFQVKSARNPSEAIIMQALDAIKTELRSQPSDEHVSLENFTASVLKATLLASL